MTASHQHITSCHQAVDIVGIDEQMAAAMFVHVRFCLRVCTALVNWPEHVGIFQTQRVPLICVVQTLKHPGLSYMCHSGLYLCACPMKISLK